MNANVTRKPRSAGMRLALTVMGALLMVGSPYFLEMSGLSRSLDRTVVIGMVLVSLSVGLALLYVALKGQEASTRP